VQNALEPISIGLMCSGVYAVAKSAIVGPMTVGMAVVSFGIIMATRVNPVYVILSVGGLGALLTYFQPALF